MFNLSLIEKYTNGNIINGNKDTIINEFCLSKDILKLNNYLFFPINFKGINREIYIIDHVVNGCLGFLINKNSINKQNIEKEAKKINPNICIIEVNDVNDALYNLGIVCREKSINKPVIAITGSIGKTTLCSLISQILETEMKVLHDFKNENNNTKSHISLSYLYFNNYDIAVTEVGISDFGVMNMLSKLTKPSIAVINSIGTAHLNKLRNKESILKEKLHITDYICDQRILFVNNDDSYLKNIRNNNNYTVQNYSLSEAEIINTENDKIEFTTKIYDKETRFKLNLYGDYYIRNIILAIKIAEIYEIKYDNIVKAINNFKAIDGRLNVIDGKENKIKIVDDSYSSSFESLSYGLNVANNINSTRKIAVLGKMAAYGEDSCKMHEEVGKLFSKLNFDYLYLTGEYTKHIFKSALSSFPEKNIKKFKTKELLISDLTKNITKGDLIYIKAANTQNFKTIVDYLRKTIS